LSIFLQKNGKKIGEMSEKIVKNSEKEFDNW